MVTVVSDPSQLTTPDKLSPSDIKLVIDSWDANQWNKVQDIGIKDGDLQVYEDPSAPTPFVLFDWFRANGVNLTPFDALKIKNSVTPEPNDLSHLVKPAAEPTPAPALADNADDSIPQPLSDVPDLDGLSDMKTDFLGDDGEDEHHLSAVLLQSEDGQRIEVFDGRPILVGRVLGKVQAVIKDSHISRVHARLMISGDKFVVSDSGSTNGTFLNGTRLDAFKDYPVSSGDTLAFSKQHVFKVSYES